jgi:Tfp pilus assembly protein PilF
LDTWATEELPDWSPENASSFYGAILEKLFLSAEERQREIERLCDGRFPSFGYATLATLVAFEGGRFNVVLTTNFDDLMADALYLFTQARPLVIQHESLANYIRPTRTRPLIVKLHGDHRLSPQNTGAETEALKELIEKQVRTLLNDRGLVFMGYGGNDEGIAKMLEALPAEALPLGVFWTGRREPFGRLRFWLESRDAIWIEKGSFDEMMLLIRDVFDLPHPERRRFEEVFEQYRATYDDLSGHIVALPDTAPDAPALKEAVRRADESFLDWRTVREEASRSHYTDPDEADRIYQKGVAQFPASAELLGEYAFFLQVFRRDYKEAEAYWLRTLAAGPQISSNISEYAYFLTTIRKDYDNAETHYRWALAADEKNSYSLRLYAMFLQVVRRDYEGAAVHYWRALAAGPKEVTNLAAYARFLESVRKDNDGAQAYYQRAVTIDPNHLSTVVSFAGFLLGRGQTEEGLALLETAFQHRDLSLWPPAAAQFWFYRFVHGQADVRPEALRNLRRVLEGEGLMCWRDVTPSAERARAEDHPDAGWIAKLASVISEGADPSILEAWSEWEKATGA